MCVLADHDHMREIRQAAERTSPMFDNVANPTPITGQIITG